MGVGEGFAVSSNSNRMQTIFRTPLTHGDSEKNNRDAEAMGLDCQHLRLPTFTLFVAVEDVHYHSQLRSIALKIDPHSPVILTTSNEIAVLCEHVTESTKNCVSSVFGIRKECDMKAIFSVLCSYSLV